MQLELVHSLKYFCNIGFIYSKLSNSSVFTYVKILSYKRKLPSTIPVLHSTPFYAYY